MKSLEYHDATKHHFNRFARSTGYLDWATQPDPFRRYAGAPLISLSRDAAADDVPFDAIFDGTAPAVSISSTSIAAFLRCSLGLSAWKQIGGRTLGDGAGRTSRWALRVNPSSGNLHPTEGYLIHDAAVSHYAPREHALEQRCTVSHGAWAAFTGSRPGFLVALTSVHWREAWKYGERAFRYCQHDAGHAIAALRFAAAVLGWRLTLLPRWSDPQIAALLGVDREDDFADAEREEPECIAAVTAQAVEPWLDADPAPLVEAARASVWSGLANALSRARVAWPIIDEVAVATRRQVSAAANPSRSADVVTSAKSSMTFLSAAAPGRAPRHPRPGARAIILQRRSAVAFDARSSLPRETFLSMLARTRPTSAEATGREPAAPPWDAIDWPPMVHLLIFVHRVDGLTPGVYAYLRDPAVLAEWRAAMRPEFLWEGMNDADDLYLLLPFDVTWVANRLSCDQDIASDGFFSLAMIARLESTLQERGEWFYRRLFWETGMLGQTLYLEAEAAGARGTGIGCFYDDPVHEAAGLSGMEWQSLYHFAMGVPIDDDRLTTEPGYPWEST
jgi:SagB-type dehydrogenase family enzyme